MFGLRGLGGVFKPKKPPGYIWRSELKLFLARLPPFAELYFWACFRRFLTIGCRSELSAMAARLFSFEFYPRMRFILCYKAA